MLALRARWCRTAGVIRGIGLRGEALARRRRPSERDLKLLFGLSAGYCAFPGCPTRCIAAATELDGEAIFGNVAHIIAHGDRGPRSDPGLPAELRDRLGNLILLCANHHAIVDAQDSTYTAEELRSWKAALETRISRQYQREMPSVTFVELQVVCDAVLGSAAPETLDLSLTTPREKMDRNRLTHRSDFLLTTGLAKAKEVQRFVDGVAALDSGFPERLKVGFTQEYNRLVEQGEGGDDLFELLIEFASRGASDLRQRAAGLAVLAYLFEKCEVFER